MLLAFAAASKPALIVSLTQVQNTRMVSVIGGHFCARLAPLMVQSSGLLDKATRSSCSVRQPVKCCFRALFYPLFPSSLPKAVLLSRCAALIWTASSRSPAG
jgi:hypothetical protein